jgi:hypothetical protein
MAGYGSIDRMVPLIVIGSVRLRPRPMARLGPFLFWVFRRICGYKKPLRVDFGGISPVSDGQKQASHGPPK